MRSDQNAHTNTLCLLLVHKFFPCTKKSNAIGWKNIIFNTGTTYIIKNSQVRERGSKTISTDRFKHIGGIIL